MTVAADAASFWPNDRGRWWRACLYRRAVTLIYAGWLPQDGLFGWSGSRV
jgi:hypothetical protein